MNSGMLPGVTVDRSWLWLKPRQAQCSGRNLRFSTDSVKIPTKARGIGAGQVSHLRWTELLEHALPAVFQQQHET